MNVLVTIPPGSVRDGFLGKEARELLEAHFCVRYLDTPIPESPEDKAFAAQTDILLTGWGSKPVSLLTLPKLKLVAHTGGSVGDLVDETTYSAGARVVSANRLYAESTAEGALAYILAALRRIPEETALMRSGYWKHGTGEKNEGLLDRTVGVVGLGAVARALMRLMQPFRVRFLVYDTYAIDPAFLHEHAAEQRPLRDVLSCHIVTLHAALNEKTHHLIGKDELALLPDGALLVNTSRGAVIDQAALVEALKENRFRAFLDVFEQEPLPEDDILRSLENVELMPHRGGPTLDRYPMIGKAIAEDALRFSRGEALLFEITREEAVRMTRHVKKP